MNSIADIIIYNGSVFTVNKNDDMAEAVAICGNKILAVGKNDDIMALKGSDTQLIDARGASVAPGFIDAHYHVIPYGQLSSGIINVAYPAVKSIAEIQELIRKAAADKKPGEWIKLNGYDHNKLAEKRHPTKEDLDAAAPENPVQLTRCCSHMGVYNSKGLEAVQIGDGSGFKPDEVVKNPDGSLHGLLKETAHMVASKKVTFTKRELTQALIDADRINASYGITSVHDAGSWGPDSMSAMQDACDNGLINTRIYTMIFDGFGKESSRNYVEHYLATGLHTGCGNEHFRIGPAKIMLDGGSSGPSCAVIDGYTHDPDNHGIQVWEQEEADEFIAKVHKAGWQMTAHAVGDKAVTVMVNAIEKAMKTYPREDCRHRIEHCGLTNPELVKRMHELGIVPIANPSFIPLNGSDYKRYYGDRVNMMFPLKSFLDGGVIAAVGSDSPVTDPNPMRTLDGALNRIDVKTGEDVGIGQRVGVKDIVRMLTYNGAYASFEENIKGSIEPGKLADIVILSDDLLTYDTGKVMDIKVRYTLIDGRIVYQA